MPQRGPERFQFTSADGLSIACVKWSGHHVRGVVQIAHGLGEHIGRYAELAETLVRGEFVVYGNDHRAHGLTAKASGSFGEFGLGGFTSIAHDFYPGGRHEMLHELNRREVFTNLLVWISGILEKAS